MPAALTRMSTFPKASRHAFSSRSSEARSADITGNAERTPTERFNLVCECVDQIHAPGAGHDVGAALRQSERKYFSDPRTAAHDNRDFP